MYVSISFLRYQDASAPQPDVQNVREKSVKHGLHPFSETFLSLEERIEKIHLEYLELVTVLLVSFSCWQSEWFSCAVPPPPYTNKQKLTVNGSIFNQFSAPRSLRIYK